MTPFPRSWHHAWHHGTVTRAQPVLPSSGALPCKARKRSLKARPFRVFSSLDDPKLKLPLLANSSRALDSQSFPHSRGSNRRSDTRRAKWTRSLRGPPCSNCSNSNSFLQLDLSYDLQSKLRYKHGVTQTQVLMRRSAQVHPFVEYVE